MSEQAVTGEVTEPLAVDAYAEAGPLTVQESTWLERLQAAQAKAAQRDLKRVHGRSKYVPHQGRSERARRLKALSR